MVFGLFGKRGSKKASKSKKSHKKAFKPKPKFKVRKVVKYAKRVAKPVKVIRPVKRVVAAAMPKMPAGPKSLDVIKAFEMLKRARLPVAPYFVIKSEKDLPEAMKKVGTPFVMKVSGSKFAHRSEVGGVMKDVSQNADVIFKQFGKIRGAEKVFAQKQLSGVELIVGAKAQEQFGYIVSIALGGTYAEILKDVAFRIMPLDMVQAQAMVRELKGFGVLESGKVKMGSLYELLMRIGKFAAENKFKEISLNPVFCNQEGCWIASAKIVK